MKCPHQIDEDNGNTGDGQYSNSASDSELYILKIKLVLLMGYLQEPIMMEKKMTVIN